TAETTERAPSQYVQELFDDYADKFDTHLVKVLQYNTPAELMALIKQVVEPPMEKWSVLDLGCGTGLMGEEIAPHALQLTGVDLSEKMLSKARARNVYHRLVHSDLLPMMRDEEASSYDVMVAADVFIYLGMLDEVVSEARRLLRPGGFFMFSVEALDALPDKVGDTDGHVEYKLNQTGRYAHSSTYLNKLASINSFKPLDMIFTQKRHEGGKPVMAWLALWEADI
ncbi:MAG: methyltransferase domain-containing protein, partial [Gallionella sp.]|nr:methyltransferase domain-containing protein [Gallionella sp.]